MSGPKASDAQRACGDDESAPARRNESGTFPWASSSSERLFAAGAATLFFVAVLRFGWMSDDAFIALRAAQNFIHGHGLVSNPGERVQAFTNPLWVLLLLAPYALLRNAYWTALSMSLVCTALSAWLIGRRREASFAPAVTLVLLAASHSFVVFSTSGLENTLAHLLLAALVLESFRANGVRARLWFVLAGLLVLNRMDLGLLVLPGLVLEARALGIRNAARLALYAFAPLVVWLAFATSYYGFPFPNTAYAKLNLAVPRADVLLQGISYLVDAALRDPLVPIVILLGVLTSVRRGRSARTIAAALGVVLYLLYVVAIGGDFMSGRFLTAPYLVMVLLVAESLRTAQPIASALAAGAALAIAVPGLRRMPVDVQTSCHVPPSGIVDERDCYAEHTGIAQNFRKPKYKTHPYYADGLKWRAAGEPQISTLVGMSGVAAGPGVHIIDAYGLTDPLIARIRFDARDFRIGHLRRSVPEGYVETVKSGENRLRDPCLKDLYDDLALITRASLFAPGRWSAIWRTNFVRRSCSAAS